MHGDAVLPTKGDGCLSAQKIPQFMKLECLLVFP
jgi:hypothetical protein